MCILEGAGLSTTRRQKLALGRPGHESGSMSYVHCPACSRAYNVAREPGCPGCRAKQPAPVEARGTDAVSTADALVRALDSASADERAAIEQMLAGTGLLRSSTELVRTTPPPPREHRLITATRAIARRVVESGYAKFLDAKSQFTRLQKASANFGRAFR
jgi:hypothetical protein